MGDWDGLGDVRHDLNYGNLAGNIRAYGSETIVPGDVYRYLNRLGAYGSASGAGPAAGANEYLQRAGSYGISGWKNSNNLDQIARQFGYSDFMEMLERNPDLNSMSVGELTRSYEELEPVGGTD